MVNSESVHSKKRSKTRCLVSPLVFIIVLEVLARAISKKIKEKASNWKGRSKAVSVCRGHDL
jgi:hypothetical protein